VSPLWRLAALSLLLAIAGGWIWGADFVQPLPLRLIGPALLALATLLIAFALRGARWALPALIMLTALDLGTYGSSYAVWPNTFRLETALSTLTDADGAKIATELRDPSRPALRVGNQMVLKGWRQLDGYAGLEPARRLDYRNVNALRVAGVERVLRSPTTETIPGLIPLDDRWLEVPDPLPRARCVADVSASSDHASDLSQLDVKCSATVDTSDMIVIEICATPIDGYWDWIRGKARIIDDRPGVIRVATETVGGQWLLVSERFHHGWTATVDGRPAELLRANGEFLGCRVPADEHVVEFTFRPASLRYGKWLTGFGLVLLVVYCFRRGRLAPRRILARQSLGAVRCQAEPGNERVVL
jgi:hypothetical protein